MSVRNVWGKNQVFAAAEKIKDDSHRKEEGEQSMLRLAVMIKVMYSREILRAIVSPAIDLRVRVMDDNSTLLVYSLKIFPV